MNEKRFLRIALAGNANVGKSVLFNQLTGLNQVVGNWPGKTVERAEGTLFFEGYNIRVIDLPGIYSLSTFSLEEIVSRDYIAVEKPDVIINVVDASALERNLYFTIQLLELEAPIVLDLNQVDFAAKKGIRIDVKKLSKALGIPVVPTVAISGVGIKELLLTVIDVTKGKIELKPLQVKYGREVEERLRKLEEIVREKNPHICRIYPSRWVAVKLLERDPAVVGKIRSYESGEEVIKAAERFASEIEKIHGEPAHVVIASERYNIANRIAQDATVFVSPPKLSLEEKLDAITSHKVLGYPILAVILGTIFAAIFLGGNILTGWLESLFYLLAGFVIVLIPCAARTVVILGLVGRFIGLHAALALYVFDLVLVFILGRIVFKALPGEPVGLIMEMPPYKRPSIKNILIKTWNRTKDFVYIAFPIIIAGSVIIEALAISGLMYNIINAMSPFFEGWLGLPSITGIPLIFGILRKELTLILLSELIPLESLTHVEMIVFSLVTMIYVPCIATIAACIHEFGWKKAMIITFLDIGLALLLGGIAFRLLSIFM